MKKYRRNIYFRQKVVELHSLLMQAKSIVYNNYLYYGLIAEDILRSFLVDVLPKRFDICQGFVEFDSKLSRQCDIIIYDQIEFSPLYSFGSIKIVPSAAVKAVIEVKTRIDKGAFQNTLIAFETLAKMGVANKFLFAYDGPTIKTIENFFYKKDDAAEGYQIESSRYDHGDEYMLPSAILNLQRDYYLKQDLVPGVDMMGYMAYKSIDKGGAQITCLQLFIENILSLVTSTIEKDSIPPLIDKATEEVNSEDTLNDIAVIGGFGLYKL